MPAVLGEPDPETVETFGEAQAEFVKTAERAQVRTQEGSVRRVTPTESTGSVGVSARIR
jgi:hypothetical protein